MELCNGSVKSPFTQELHGEVVVFIKKHWPIHPKVNELAMFI